MKKWLRVSIVLFAFCVICAFIYFLITLTTNENYSGDHDITSIEVNQIKLLMTRKEVERILGIGPDTTYGCFGCEMNFIYPKIQLSGRYSETLDRRKKNGDYDENQSPKVKKLTTADPTVSILGINIGDTILKSKETLESKGFIFVNDLYYSNYYNKGNLYVRLWTDQEIDSFKKNTSYFGQDNEVVRSITIEIRVLEDEKISY
jgi:hypothetical protein